MKPLTKCVLTILLLSVQIQIGWAAIPPLICLDRHAAPQGQDNEYYDGFYIGAGGCLYDPVNTDIKDVPPFAPMIRAPGSHFWWHVNGASTSPKQAALQLRDIAQTIHAPVIGIYNASADNGTSADDLSEGFIKRHTPPIRTLVTQILLALDQHQEVYVRGGSQGTVIISAALKQVHQILSEGLFHTQIEAERAMRRIAVETNASITFIYPDGPRYVHYVNILDPTQVLGVLNPNSHPGKSAVIVLFKAVVTPFEEQYKNLMPKGIFFLSRHGQSAYLSHRIGFDEAYSYSNPLGLVTPVSYHKIQRQCAGSELLNRCGSAPLNSVTYTAAKDAWKLYQIWQAVSFARQIWIISQSALDSMPADSVCQSIEDNYPAGLANLFPNLMLCASASPTTLSSNVAGIQAPDDLLQEIAPNLYARLQGLTSGQAGSSAGDSTGTSTNVNEPVAP